MERRSFIKALLAGCVAPMFLPGAGRLWVPERKIVSCRDFTKFLLSQTPYYENAIRGESFWILNSLSPEASLIGSVETGEWN
jgi:hypothetical protein